MKKSENFLTFFVILALIAGIALLVGQAIGQLIVPGCTLVVIALCGIMFVFGKTMVLSDTGTVGWLVSFFLMICFVVSATAAASYVVSELDLGLSPLWFALLGPISYLSGYTSWWIKIGRKRNHKFGRFLFCG